MLSSTRVSKASVCWLVHFLFFTYLARTRCLIQLISTCACLRVNPCLSRSTSMLYVSKWCCLYILLMLRPPPAEPCTTESRIGATDDGVDDDDDDSALGVLLLLLLLLFLLLSPTTCRVGKGRGNGLLESSVVNRLRLEAFLWRKDLDLAKVDRSICKLVGLRWQCISIF